MHFTHHDIAYDYLFTFQGKDQINKLLLTKGYSRIFLRKMSSQDFPWVRQVDTKISLITIPLEEVLRLSSGSVESILRFF